MQIEKLVDAAVDLRIVNLRAREQGIIGYGQEIKDCTTEYFQFHGEKDFKEIISTRPYLIKECKDSLYKYEYRVKVCGLNFIHITTDLLNADDADKIESEDK